jgi:hypothetical protein
MIVIVAKVHVFCKERSLLLLTGASYVTTSTRIYDLIRPWANCHMGNAVTFLSKVKKTR